MKSETTKIRDIGKKISRSSIQKRKKFCWKWSITKKIFADFRDFNFKKLSCVISITSSNDLQVVVFVLYFKNEIKNYWKIYIYNYIFYGVLRLIFVLLLDKWKIWVHIAICLIFFSFNGRIIDDLENLQGTGIRGNIYRGWKILILLILILILRLLIFSLFNMVLVQGEIIFNMET